MSVVYDPKHEIFHLTAGDMSYVMQVVKGGSLAHLYWGKKLREPGHAVALRFVDRPFSPNPLPDDRTFSLDTLPQEYPSYGRSDFRAPAIHVLTADGSTVTDLTYQRHRIIPGKPKLSGLPACYVEQEDEATTLEIELLDRLTGLQAVLSYTVYRDANVLTRSVRLVNAGEQEFRLLRVLSMNVDFRDAGFDLLHLSGSWADERNIIRRRLAPGMQSVESRRGASSHHHNPFIALLREGANEDHGDVYGFNLVYSGNFLAQVEVDGFASARVGLGINPFDFTWLLAPGESFQAPEAVLVYSAEGLGGMSRTYHRLYRSRLCRGAWRDRERPILINSWEAVYFDINEESLVRMAQTAGELGMELFVLDDGWFGQRDDDKRSLGDWVVNRRKLPGGLDGLAREVSAAGMAFGLWVEPEMISEESDLYRAHPDWCLHVAGRPRSTGRNQLVLDFSRPEVCDHIIRVMSELLSSAPIRYVKWDMNRHMTEIGSAALPPERQRETAHRYILGLYRVLETLTSSFPDVLFESCSGGGGRFDPGMLYYMPQTWTSDNTDAVSRLNIQYGTSLVYPAITMGAHVSAVPNHQVGRVTPLEMRGHVAMSGNFGYELDVTRLSPEDQEMVKEQIRLYREIRPLVQFGDLYRLKSPFEGNEAAWMYVSPDRSRSFAAWFRVLGQANPPLIHLRLRGLDPDRRYRVVETGEVYGGDELMFVGLPVPLRQGDFQSAVWRLDAV